MGVWHAVVLVLAVLGGLSLAAGVVLIVLGAMASRGWDPFK